MVASEQTVSSPPAPAKPWRGRWFKLLGVVVLVTALAITGVVLSNNDEPAVNPDVPAQVVIDHAAEATNLKLSLENSGLSEAERAIKLRNLGEQYNEAGNYASAAEAFQQAIDLAKYPDHNLYMGLGFALENQSDLSGAVAAYEKGLALAQDPSDPKADPASRATVNMLQDKLEQLAKTD